MKQLMMAVGMTGLETGRTFEWVGDGLGGHRDVVDAWATADLGVSAGRPPRTAVVAVQLRWRPRDLHRLR